MAGVTHVSAGVNLTQAEYEGASAHAVALNGSEITAGSINVARMPTMTDAEIPDLETLSYGGAFNTAQIPAHAASHKDSGADELDVSELAGAIGGAGEIPETDGAAVTWVDPDSRYDPKAHVL
ncbi:unnamed protein product, partial [marine sediment metagenome]